MVCRLAGAIRDACSFLPSGNICVQHNKLQKLNISLFNTTDELCLWCCVLQLDTVACIVAVECRQLCTCGYDVCV